MRDNYLTKNDLKKIETKFDFIWGEFNEESSWDESTTIENVKNDFKEFCKNLDALVSHGSPYVDIDIIKNAKILSLLVSLKEIGFLKNWLEASFKNGLNVVDTTHGSSYQ